MTSKSNSVNAGGGMSLHMDNPAITWMSCELPERVILLSFLSILIELIFPYKDRTQISSSLPDTPNLSGILDSVHT